MKYPAVLDLHTHTTASGHAYCSLREMAKAAADLGLAALGITEHAPKMQGTCQLFYFQNLKIVPRQLYGIQLFLGTEVNIMDFQGNMDLSDKVLKNMDVVIASLHTACIRPGTRAENTNAYLEVLKNPYVNIIGHPDDGRYPIDYLALVQAAKEHGKLLELNNHSLSPICFRSNAKENDRALLKYCMQYQVPVIMGSDAHFDSYIAEFSNARKLLEEMDFPEELVVNRSLEALRPYINKKDFT